VPIACQWTDANVVVSLTRVVAAHGDGRLFENRSDRAEGDVQFVSMSVSTVRVARLSAVVFLASAIPFGVLTAAFSGVATGFARNGVAWGVAAGAGFGALMTACLVGLHVARARRPDGAVADVCQSDAFVISGDLEYATAVAERALRDLGVAPLLPHPSDVVVLEGRTPMSWRSWGEIVRVELGPTTSGSVPVHVASRPAWRTTLVDYGKNLANIDALRTGMTS
jgi:hypothetical protein